MHLCKYSRTCWTLPVTSCSCTYLVPHGRNHPAGNYSLLPDPAPHVQAAMTSLAHKKKQTSRSEGFSTRAHVLRSSVTCTVHSANRTHRAGHVEFYTRAHVQNPSSPNPPTQPDLCPSAGSATSPRAFPDRVSYHRNRARGGLVRGTARTTRARPCRPGTVPYSNYRRYPAFGPP